MKANTVLVHSLVNLAHRIAVSLVRLPSLTRARSRQLYGVGQKQQQKHAGEFLRLLYELAPAERHFTPRGLEKWRKSRKNNFNRRRL
jgi:hypothetical protein